MPDVMLLMVLVAGLVACWLLWLRIRLQQRSRERLSEGLTPAPLPLPPRAGPPLIRTHAIYPWVLGALLALALEMGLRCPRVFAITFGVMAALLVGQLEQWRVATLTLRIEQQFSDAIDLMVAALQAGSGTLAALESAIVESRPPMKGQFEELLGRIRFGEDPIVVLRAFEARIPLEVCRLFVSVLTVHWETGGSLAPTLTTVGRVARDRIEVNRRIRTLTTQGRASVVAVLALTYGLALVMWRNDPDRMTRFLSTDLGQTMTAGAMLLQTVGIVWTANLSRLRY